MGNIEKLSTLHPQNEPDVDLYPNIKLENIPQEAFDNEATEGSLKLVNSDLLYRSLIGKQDVLEFDNEPTQDSTKMVNSGGIYNYIQNLDIYQRTLSVGNLILIDDNNTISVDKSKVDFDNNAILGIDNTVDELAGHTAITNTVLGYQNKISKDSIDGVIANTDILIGYKNETYSFNYYTTLLGQENYAYYAQNSLALGYKNKIGNRYSSPDDNLIAIGNNNNVGNATTKICKNIIGIGNNINNQDDYTFVIDTNASGTYGTNRSSLVGNLQGLYYNGAKMATEAQVDDKLDKVTTTSAVMQAYIKQTDGSQQMVFVHWDNIRDTIPIRDQTGNIRVALVPTISTHATSKQYVDDAIAAAIASLQNS